VKVTKLKGFGYFNLACKWKRKLKGIAPKEGWFILTDLPELGAAITAYKQRFDIEEMFRDFKTGGYNLEDTGDLTFDFPKGGHSPPSYQTNHAFNLRDPQKDQLIPCLVDQKMCKLPYQ
jgi:hypothetical protein